MIDKLVGDLARRQWPLEPLVMAVSGRISFEMVQKAAVAGIPVIAGVSGASSLVSRMKRPPAADTDLGAGSSLHQVIWSIQWIPQSPSVPFA